MWRWVTCLPLFLVLGSCGEDDLAKFISLSPPTYVACPMSATPPASCESTPGLCDQPASYVRPRTEAHAFKVIFVPEGYPASELPAFDARVEALVAELQADSNGLVGRRIDRFDFRRLDVASEGTDLLDGDLRDTAFGGCLDEDRESPPLLTVDRNRVRLAVNMRSGSRPRGADADVIVVVLNTPYGRPNADLMGELQPLVRINRVASAATLDHELGHALVGLGDEYTELSGCLPPPFSPLSEAAFSTRPNDVAEPNLTLDPAGTKWAGLVNGALEGGDRFACGVYHPTASCRMLDSGASGYCPVCSHAIDARLREADPSFQDGPPSCDVMLNQKPGALSGHVTGWVLALDHNGAKAKASIGTLQFPASEVEPWFAWTPFTFDTADTEAPVLHAICTDGLGATTERTIDLSRAQ